MAWPLGLSWTKSFREISQNPNGSYYTNYGIAGPFLYERIPLAKWRTLEFYVGCKPTGGYDPRYDNSVLVRFLSPLINLVNKIGAGNLGIALRLRRMQ